MSPTPPDEPRDDEIDEEEPTLALDDDLLDAAPDADDVDDVDDGAPGDDDAAIEIEDPDGAEDDAEDDAEENGEDEAEASRSSRRGSRRSGRGRSGRKSRKGAKSRKKRKREKKPEAEAEEGEQAPARARAQDHPDAVTTPSGKNSVLAFQLCLLGGWVGLDRLYLGHYALGLAKAGCAGVAALMLLLGGSLLPVPNLLAWGVAGVAVAGLLALQATDIFLLGAGRMTDSDGHPLAPKDPDPAEASPLYRGVAFRLAYSGGLLGLDRFYLGRGLWGLIKAGAFAAGLGLFLLSGPGWRGFGSYPVAIRYALEETPEGLRPRATLQTYPTEEEAAAFAEANETFRATLEETPLRPPPPPPPVLEVAPPAAPAGGMDFGAPVPDAAGGAEDVEAGPGEEEAEDADAAEAAEEEEDLPLAVADETTDFQTGEDAFGAPDALEEVEPERYGVAETEPIPAGERRTVTIDLPASHMETVAERERRKLQHRMWLGTAVVGHTPLFGFLAGFDQWPLTAGAPYLQYLSLLILLGAVVLWIFDLWLIGSGLLRDARGKRLRLDALDARFFCTECGAQALIDLHQTDLQGIVCPNEMCRHQTPPPEESLLRRLAEGRDERLRHAAFSVAFGVAGFLLAALTVIAAQPGPLPAEAPGAALARTTLGLGAAVFVAVAIWQLLFAERERSVLEF